MEEVIAKDKLVVALKDKVSTETYNAYKERLRRLVEATGRTLIQTIRQFKRSNDILEEKYDSITTRRNVIDALLSLFIHTPSLVKKEFTAYEAWTRKQRALRELVKKARGNNRMTPEIKAKYIDLEETRGIARKLHKVIVSKSEPSGALSTLPKFRLSQDYLLMLLMVDVPPKRADLGELLIVKSPKEAPEGGNYVVVPDKGAATLVLRDFKTAKSYNMIQDVLPKNVTDAIRESLKSFPRTYLFTGHKVDTPLAPKVYADMVKRVFLRHTGKPAGINALRHAYITQMADHSKVTFTELGAMARSMGHSPLMQNQYQLVEGGGVKPGK